MSKNKRIIFILAGLIVFNAISEAKEVSKTGFIKDIRILFLKEEYASLIQKADKKLKYYRLSRTEKKEVLYLTGISYIKTGHYEDARKTFEDILELKGNEFREETYIGIADSYYNEQRYDKAINAYEDVLNMYPRSNRLSGIYYNLGLSYKAIGDAEKANYYFQKVSKQYTQSFEADTGTYVPIERKQEYYIVQLGAFNSLKNAKKMVKGLSRKGYESYIQKVERNGETLYRVRAGKFSNKYYASRLQRKLKRDRFSAKIIIE
jgi:tetratricopeptide (TPR) repeat protein